MKTSEGRLCFSSKAKIQVIRREGGGLPSPEERKFAEWFMEITSSGNVGLEPLKAERAKKYICNKLKDTGDDVELE